MSALDRLQHPMLRELYAYWDRKRDRRPMPHRADIDPAEIKPLLPHLMIVDVVEDGGERRFRYRLVGSALVDAFGVNYVGTYVGGTTTGEYRELLLQIYRIAFEGARPVYSRSRYHRVDSAPKTANRLLLPLSTDGQTVDQVISLHVFDYDGGKRLASAPLERLGVSDNSIEVLSSD